MRATIVCVLAFMVAYSEAYGSTAGKSRSGYQVKNEETDSKLAAAQAKLYHMKNQAQVKANRVAQEPVLKQKIVKCNLDSDCPGAQECVNYAPKLSALSRSVGASADQFSSMYWKTKAHIKRCKDTSFPKMPIDTIEEKIEFQRIMTKSMTIIRETYVKLNRSGLNMTLPPNFDNIDEITMKNAMYYNEITGNVVGEDGKMPMVRTTEVAVAAAPALDMNTFLLISLLDKDSSSSSLSKLLPIILMSQGGTGMGGDLMSNPLLLLTLLDDDKSSSSSSDLLLIMILMNQGGLGGTTDLLSSPLLLITLLKDNSSISDLLPILLLSGGLGPIGGAVAGTGRSAMGGVPVAGGIDIMSNPLILLLLLDDNNSTLSKLLPIILLGSMQGSGMGGMGGAAGMGSMLPLLLLLDLNISDTSDLLLLMMASGGALGAGGATAGADLGGLLPILLLGDKLGGGLNSTKDLLLFSMLGGGGLGGAGGAGGLGGILPLLLLTNSSLLNTSDSLLMVLLLSGGLGGGAGAGVGGAAAPNMNMLLPLILKDSLNDTKDLLLIMMMGGLGGGAGGAAGMQSILPLLLLGNTSDTSTLVLIMMMAQAQPGTVGPIDGSTGLTIGAGSGLNSLLPLILMKDSGSDDTLTTLLLMNMLSMGAPTATSGSLLVGK